MSGICGIIYFDGREVNEELQLMIHPLSHRGPDGIKLYQNGSVGLAHLMLHVTYESLYEQQPLIHSSGLILVADARIDNRKELYEQLALYKTASPLREPDGTIIAEQPLSHTIKQSISNEPTDAELIPAAYQQWGDDLLYHLVGDFAFALWDENRQSLICGRDHSGVRPFYYYHKPFIKQSKLWEDSANEFQFTEKNKLYSNALKGDKYGFIWGGRELKNCPVDYIYCLYPPSLGEKPALLTGGDAFLELVKHFPLVKECLMGNRMLTHFWQTKQLLQYVKLLKFPRPDSYQALKTWVEQVSRPEEPVTN